jgi:glycosyltransferase involved in cell wall biosynthesis
VSRLAKVHQLLPTLSWGDAVSNHVLHLQALLRARGFESEVFAGRWDAGCADKVHDARTLESKTDARSVVLVHHSFESRFVPLLQRTAARVFMMFHNITPAWHFERFDRGLAGACEAGRRELYELAPRCERAFAYSRYSAEELSACGYPAPEVFPFTVDWKAFDAPADAAFAAQFQDGCTNLLFVGRAVPNKRLEDVLRVHTAYQRLFDPGARLLVAGQFNLHTPYVGWIKELRSVLG